MDDRAGRGGAKRPLNSNRIKSADSSPAGAGSILSASFAHLGIAAKIKEHKIRKLWEECVGAQIAVKARPMKLIGSTLYCAVSSSPWMSELNYQKAAIISKINKKAGSALINEIIFKIGPAATREAPAAKRQTRPITPDERLFIEKATSKIKDEKLRAAIRRAYEKGKF